ncbi:MAG: hypothetical protein ACKO25_06355 [Cyanobium sp.]
MPLSLRLSPRSTLRPGLRLLLSLLPALLALPMSTAMAVSAGPARGHTLVQIHRLESLINDAGTETMVRHDCLPNHAGFYERDGAGLNRLVVCANNIDMADLRAVWEVMAHEGTHVMQECAGGTVLQDSQLPRTLGELRRRAPHYAKLIVEGYDKADQRIEAEAFWMELQPAEVVIDLFQRHCLNPARLQPSLPQPAHLQPQPQSP